MSAYIWNELKGTNSVSCQPFVKIVKIEFNLIKNKILFELNGEGFFEIIKN